MGKRIAMRTARIQAQAKVATARRAAAAAAAAAAAKENNSVFNHHHHYLESGLTGGRADPHGHSHHVPSKLMGSSPYASDPMLANSVECGNSCSGSTFTSPRLSNAAMTTEMRYRAATLQGGGGGGGVAVLRWTTPHDGGCSPLLPLLSPPSRMRRPESPAPVPPHSRRPPLPFRASEIKTVSLAFVQVSI